MGSQKDVYHNLLQHVIVLSSQPLNRNISLHVNNLHFVQQMILEFLVLEIVYLFEPFLVQLFLLRVYDLISEGKYG